MQYLNLGCGATRPGAPWVNLDTLHDQLSPGTNERRQLDSEPNYINHDLLHSLPFPADSIDGILCSHVLEHFDCHQAASIVRECYRVLKHGCPLVVSVPNAEYFLEVHDQDIPERANELFGEPICPAEPWHQSFFDYALFYHQHKQILTPDSLQCLLLRGGFKSTRHSRGIFFNLTENALHMGPLLNRFKFSVVLCTTKQV